MLTALVNASNDTYFFEDFDEAPVLDIRLLVGGKDEDLLALGAHGHHTAIGTPRKALDPWQDPVRIVNCLCFLQHCLF